MSLLWLAMQPIVICSWGVVVNDGGGCGSRGRVGGGCVSVKQHVRLQQHKQHKQQQQYLKKRNLSLFSTTNHYNYWNPIDNVVMIWARGGGGRRSWCTTQRTLALWQRRRRQPSNVWNLSSSSSRRRRKGSSLTSVSSSKEDAVVTAVTSSSTVEQSSFSSTSSSSQVVMEELQVGESQQQKQSLVGTTGTTTTTTTPATTTVTCSTSLGDNDNDDDEQQEQEDDDNENNNANSFTLRMDLLPQGKPDGFYVVKHYTLPNTSFEELLACCGASGGGFGSTTATSSSSSSNSSSTCNCLNQHDLERLQVSFNNLSLPVALVLLDPLEYPTLSRARKACRKGNILIHRGPLIPKTRTTTTTRMSTDTRMSRTDTTTTMSTTATTSTVTTKLQDRFQRDDNNDEDHHNNNHHHTTTESVDKDDIGSSSSSSSSSTTSSALLTNTRPIMLEFNMSCCLIGRVGDRVYPGDVIGKQVRMGNGNYPFLTTTTTCKAPSFHVPVIYQDNEWALVNKPAGIVVYSNNNKKKNNQQGRHEDGSSSRQQTLRAALPFVLDPPKVGTYSIMKRPASVHRLDKPTSGLICIAKTKPAMINLSRQFHDRKVQKTYIAIVNGIPQPEPMETTTRITIQQAQERFQMDLESNHNDNDNGGNDHNNNNNQSTSHDYWWQILDTDLEGQSAITIWRVLQYIPSLHAKDGYLTLVELKPKTGRYHQLRRHMAWFCHCPIVGDHTYNGDNNNGGIESSRKQKTFRHHGLFLCATEIVLEHPVYNSMPHGRRRYWQQQQEQQQQDQKQQQQEQQKNCFSYNNNTTTMTKENASNSSSSSHVHIWYCPKTDKVMIQAKIDLPSKFETFLEHERLRYEKFNGQADIV